MLQLGAELESRDLDKQPLTEKELDDLIDGRDYRTFLNPRNEVYRERNMARKVPPRANAIRLMSKNPNLLRRPVVLRDTQIVLGLDEVAYRKLLQ